MKILIAKAKRRILVAKTRVIANKALSAILASMDSLKELHANVETHKFYSDPILVKQELKLLKKISKAITEYKQAIQDCPADAIATPSAFDVILAKFAA